jgi:primosomal protein N'
VHERIAGENRFQILLKCRTPQGRARALESLTGFKPLAQARLSIDVDPLNML